MKFVSTNIIELMIDKRYSIKMYCFNNTIKAYSKDLQSLKEWSGLVLGLPINMFIWMSKRSAWASSRFSLNPTTLEVKYLEGLKGGGSCVTKNKELVFSPRLNNQRFITNKLEENQIITVKLAENASESMNELKINQMVALELAENISESMKEMTIELNEISLLENANPHKCADPYVIAMKLLENFDITEYWAQPEYFEVRAAVASIIRRFLLAYFIKNQKVVSMTELDKKDKIDKIDKVIKIINRNEKLLPEICTLVELEIIKKLIYEACDTQNWWQKVLKELKEVKTAVAELQIFNPTLVKVTNYFEKNSKKLRGEFHKYAFQFEIFEKENAESINLQEQIQCLIEKELEKINQLGWEEAHILLDFFENCIKKGKINKDFVLNVLKTHLPNIRQNKAWQIKIKVVNILRSLRGHWDSDIFQTANNLYEVMKLDEQDSRLEIILGLSPKFLDNPSESQLRISQFKDDFITNKVYSIDLIVGREEIIQDIHKRFQNNNICMITGMGGIGKTSVALKYADDFKKCYQIIWVVKSNSITLDLISLATKLGISKNNYTLENFMISLKSQKIVKSVLLIFDNLERKTQLDDYYTTSENIKYLITSRNTEWEECIELGPLSYTKSEDYLKLRLFEQDENEESIKSLAQRMNGIALSLRQSVVCIKINKFSIQKYLELIQDLTSEEATAKTFELIASKINNKALELLSYFQPQDIPEDSIKTILVEKFGVKEWRIIRSQLIRCFIVRINIKRKWNIDQYIIEFIRSKNNQSMRNLLIKYYYENFRVDSNIYSEKYILKQVKKLFPHLKYFVKEIKFNNIMKISIYCNLVSAIIILDFNFEEAEQILEKIIDKANKIIDKTNKIIEDNLDFANIWENIGDIFYNIGNYERSEEFFMKCLEIREQILPPNHSDLASIYKGIGNLYVKKADYTKSEKFLLKCLEMINSPELENIYNSLGVLYMDKEDYKKSKEFYLKSLTIWEKFLPLHQNLSTIYINIGKLYIKKANYIKSEEFYFKSLKICEQILPSLHPDLAMIYNNIGELYSDKGDYIKSEEFFMKCLEIREQILPPNHPDLASIYKGIGDLYVKKADYTKSEEFLLKCFKIRQQILKPLHPDLANICNSLGVLYMDKEDYTKSEEFYLKSLMIWEQTLPPLHKNLSAIYFNIGKLYSKKTDYTKSEMFYFKSLNIREQILPSNHSDLAIIYNNIGELYNDNGDYIKSEEFFMKCLKIREEILPQFHSDLIFIYSNIGNLFNNKKDYAKSEEFYLKCLKISEKILEPLDKNLVGIYYRIGLLYRNNLDFTKSEEFYLKSLMISEKILPQNHEDLGIIYFNIGILYHEKADYIKSEEFFMKSLKIREQILIPLHPDLAILYNYIGLMYYYKEDYLKAEEFLFKCLKIQDQILGPNHPDQAHIYYTIAELYNRKSDYTKSEEFYLKCLDIYEQDPKRLDSRLVIIHISIGNLYSEKKDYIKSEEFYLKGLMIQEQILTPLDSNLADIYYYIGLLYYNIADYAKCEDFYIKCVNIREQILQPLHSNLADIYYKIGLLYNKKTDYSKSEEFFTKSLKIREQILPPLHPDLARVYNGMRLLYSNKTETTKSEEFYLKYLKIREQLSPQIYPDLE
ncbi:hypothetical protein SteCoe_17420 [Stentor coeruleus]|uniref:NB-ARC domain-containing protein n=1 Tax=Stentor coeruleus TaxID=5963 RepID=A0A1R2BYX0_9CILI|nr:hypothetical protein SteCoe_17420 [Stentor coeruleus]